MIGAQQAADAKAKAEEKERKEAELAQVVAPPRPSLPLLHVLLLPSMHGTIRIAPSAP